MLHIVSRMSLILSCASLGLALCGFVVEAFGYVMPIGGWVRNLLVYAGVFYGIHRWTRSPTGKAQPSAADDPADRSNRNEASTDSQ